MSSLDAEELLHLGLHATAQDDPSKAIDLLKQCLALDPVNAKASYMLGALYAQIGMYDRAKEILTHALESDPSLSTAAFQLGLLHLTSGAVDAAATTWQRLDELPHEHALNFFRHGMLALVQDRFSDCVDLLERGIAANDFNEALNDDMRRVRESAAAATGGAVLKTGDTQSATLATVQRVLGSYSSKQRPQ